MIVASLAIPEKIGKRTDGFLASMLDLLFIKACTTRNEENALMFYIDDLYALRG